MLSGLRSSRGFVSVSVLLLVGAVSVVGVVGSGLSGSVLGALPGSAWLSSSVRGDVVLANGANGAGVARVGVPGAKGSKMSVVQRGGFACVRAERPGGVVTVNCVDDATFGDAGSTRVRKSQQVLRTGSHAYLVDEGKGLVQPLDPGSLKPDGKALSFEAPISTVADDGGRLLVLELGGSVASVVVGASAGEPVSVGSAGGDVFGALVNGRFAVVAQADSEVTLFDGGRVDRRVGLPGELGSLLVPGEVDGGEFPLLSRVGGGVEVVVLDTTTDKGRRVKVKSDLPGSSEVFATSAGLFIPDRESGALVRVDIRSGETESIDMGVGKGADNVEVFVKDDKLWVNNPNGSKAVVIDGRGVRHEVNKYDRGIEEVDLGWESEPAGAPSTSSPSGGSGDVPPVSVPPVSVPPVSVPPVSVPPVSVPSTSAGQPVVSTPLVTVPVDPGVGPPAGVPTPSSGPGGGTLGGGGGPATSGKPVGGADTTKKGTVTTERKGTVTTEKKGSGGEGSVSTDAPKPGEPPRLSALTVTPGSGSASVSWGVSGQVDSYVLSCDQGCRPPRVGADAMTVTVDGLSNGTTYRFTLVAVNSNGESEPARGEGTPLGNTPDQVKGVVAEAVRGTVAGVAGPVRVTWDPETGSGLNISRYMVTAAGGGAELGPFEASGTQSSLEVPAGELGPMDDDAAGDWSFTVQAVSTKAGTELAGDASSRSNEVDLFSVPSVPVATVTPGDEVVSVGLSVESAGGRPVEFVVDGAPVTPGADTPRVATKRIDGLVNGVENSYGLAVRHADGFTVDGSQITAIAHTAPTITVGQTSKQGYNEAVVTYTIVWNGTPGTCKFSDGTTCNLSGTTASFAKTTAGPHAITMTAINGQGDNATPADFNVTVDVRPPPTTQSPTSTGRACANNACTVNYVNRFSDSGKMSFSPSGRYPVNTQKTVLCWSDGYRMPGYTGRYFKIASNDWVLEEEFQIVSGPYPKQCP